MTIKNVPIFRAEIEDLQNAAIRERDRYKESTQLMSDGISAIPMLPVNDSVSIFVSKWSIHSPVHESFFHN